MLYVMPFLLAMVVTMASMPILGRVASGLGIVDRPGVRKIHQSLIPRIGGIGMLIGVLAAALMVIPLQPQDGCFICAAVLLAAFGAADDRFDLDYRIKLIGQLIAVLIVVFFGDTQIHFITLDDRVYLPAWISAPLTVVFLVGVTNAINLADGLDGLAGGTTFLCLGAVALLAVGSGQTGAAALALAFAGAVLGFLRFNTFPASVFMGDAGSQLLGFAVGVLALRATQNGMSAISAATPILLLALPILDTLSVMAQRVGEGRSPFSADKNHIHHKLLDFGFDHHEAVMVIYIIQAILFVLAYGLRYESDLVILAAVSAFFVAVIGTFQLAGRRRWRFRAGAATKRNSPLARFLSKISQPAYLPRWSYLLTAVSVGVYALLVLIKTAKVSSDVELLLVALLVLTCVLLAVLRSKPFNIVEKAALYVTAAILAYLDTVMLAPDEHLLSAFCWIAIAAAALGTALRLRMDPERRFQLTPLDLIVLFGALVVPSLLGSAAMAAGGAIGIAKLVILFYAIEVLVSRVELEVMWLRVSIAAVLTVLVLRPLLPV